MADIDYWITVNGVHVPIIKGEKKSDSIKRHFEKIANKNSDIKEKQLSGDSFKDDTLFNDEMQEVGSKDFPKDVTHARDTRPISDKWRVDDTHTAEDYDKRGCKCFKSEGGSVAAVDKDGDIISICRAKGDSISGEEIMAHAVKMGGTKLDSFTGNHKFYSRCGFQAVSWTPFNREHAPDGWAEANSAGLVGKEDVVFYKYVGVGKVTTGSLKSFLKNTKPFKGEDGYDKAMAYRDNSMGGKKK